MAFGRTSRYGSQTTSETWAFDVRGSTWHRAACGTPPEGGVPREEPGGRAFTADAGGCGGILHDALGQAWLVIFSGSRPGVRDNETWILGPLGHAASAAGWTWHQVRDLLTG